VTAGIEFPADFADDVPEVAATRARGVDPNAVEIVAERLGRQQALALLVPEGVDQPARSGASSSPTASSNAVHAAA